MKVIGSLIHDCDSGLNKPEVGSGQLVLGKNIHIVNVKDDKLFLIQDDDDVWWSVTDYHLIECDSLLMSMRFDTLDDVFEKYK